MVVAAVTGNPASGKSTVLRMLQREGLPTHRADTAVRNFYRNNAQEVRRLLGTTDRRQIRQILMREPSLWRRLEDLIHPFVAQDRAKFLKAHTSQSVACEVPLLFEKCLERQFDLVLLTVAPLEVRKARLDPSWFSTLEQRFIVQEKKIHRAHVVIDTNKPLPILGGEVRALAQKILSDSLIP